MTPEREEMVVSLKEYFDTRFSSLKEATELARKNIEQRLEVLNENRQDTLSDRSKYVQRELHDRLENELRELGERLVIIETRSVTWTSVLGLFFTVIQIGSALTLYFILHK